MRIYRLPTRFEASKKSTENRNVSLFASLFPKSQVTRSNDRPNVWISLQHRSNRNRNYEKNTTRSFCRYRGCIKKMRMKRYEPPMKRKGLSWPSNKNQNLIKDIAVQVIIFLCYWLETLYYRHESTIGILYYSNISNLFQERTWRQLFG